MFELLTRYWWVLVVRGVLAIALGILAFFSPWATFQAFLLVFGAYAFVDGIFSIVSAFGGRREDDDWWIVLLEGIAGILIGVVTFIAPDIAATALLIYIAAWALAKGVLEIVAAIRLRKVIQGELWLALAGVASIVFAFLLMAFPAAGVLGMLWVIGAYAIVFGILFIVLGFRVRGMRTQLRPAHART